MKFRLGSIVIPALLALLTGFLYLPSLADTPIHLTPDEVFSALTAHSVASTGRDLNGRFMPLYFQLPKPFVTRMWYQPILMYAISAGVKALPFSEGTIRLPMTLAAVLSVLLMYGVGRLLFRSQLLAIAAALLLALTPAHFINSRVAMDFHAPLPFILGWLLCLLIYLQRNKPLPLFAAGALLGVGLYTYIASYVFMPAYLLITGIMLYRRREPLSRYGVLAAGFLIPGLIWLPFLLTHPTLISDTLWRYERDTPRADTLTLLRAFFNYKRLVTACSLYWGFVNPAFLFINGPRMMWGAGVFLLPMAGLLPAGVLRTLWHRDSLGLALLFGLLTAPLPASIVDEPQAIHRAAVGLPFAVLLAVVGLDYLRTAEPAKARRLGFVALWATVIALATAYHDSLPHAQAIVRASTIPLAVTGLAVLVGPLRLADVGLGRLTLVAAAALLLTHFAYFVANHATTVSVALLAGISLATLLGRAPDRVTREPILTVVLLTLVTTHFLYVYVDYAELHRWGAIPASAVVLGMRLVFSALALAAVIGVVKLLNGEAIDGLQGGQLAAIATIGILVAELAYFAVDSFTDYRLRFVQATMVLVAVVGLAMLVRGGEPVRLRLWHLAFAGLLGLASIQFTIFYRGYFTGPLARKNADDESKARVAFETVIDRTSNRGVPAIYLGKIGPYAVGELYWNFYLIKHHREDLVAQTVPDLAFDPDRIRRLPGGSIIITSQAPEVDSTIDAMMARGELKRRELLIAPDGTPTFWILETAR